MSAGSTVYGYLDSWIDVFPVAIIQLIKPRGTFHLYHEEYLSSLQAREAISLAKGELKIIRDELLRLDWAM